MGSMNWGPGLNKFTGYLQSRSKYLTVASEDLVVDTTKYAAELMRKYIASRGTGYVGRGPRATADGRIDYGRMYDAVQAGDVTKTGGRVRGNFGWGVNGSEREEYFFWQEKGFKNVPPMHALLDATVQAREYFYAHLKDTLRNER